MGVTEQEITMTPTTQTEDKKCSPTCRCADCKCGDNCKCQRKAD